MKKSFIVVSIFVAICILSVGTVIINNNYKKVSLSHNNIIKETNTEYEYIPIPIEKQAQYKQEMEQIINKKYSIVIKDIDDSIKNAKILHDKMLKNGFNTEDYISLSLIPETNIPSADLDLYTELLKVTMEKYMGIKYKPIGTDSIKPMDELLSPYFKDNNVNKEKLSEISLYKNKQIKVVENYIKQIEQIKPSNI